MSIEDNARRRLLRIFLIAGTLAFLLVLLVVVLLTASFVRTAQNRARVARATAEVDMFSTAFRLYWAEYGSLPSGDDVALMKVLMATNSDNQNPKRIVFIDVSKRLFDAQGRYLDPWRTPYRFVIDGEAHTIQVKSLGPNGIDDGANQDDVVASQKLSAPDRSGGQ